MRTVGVVTGSRADYGIFVPLLRAIQAEPSLALHLMVTGMHLSPEFGLTVKGIEEDGFPIAERVEMLLSSDTPSAIAKSMGIGTIGFAQAFARNRLDILVVLGDRFEMHAAAIAAVPFNIPLAHIHGGEVTEGTFDNALRHSMTMLSHLHFVATDEYGQRLIQMGEEPWRVTVSGALSLDNLQATKLLSRENLEAMIGLSLERPPLLITFHPVTLEYEQAGYQISELLEALRGVNAPLVFTMSNADTNSRLITQKIREFVQAHASARLVENLGTRAYFSLMAQAAAMVGNSSSGIIEAMSFGLPAVNIGTRQAGRVRLANVVDVGYAREEIRRGLRQALAPEAKAGLQGQANLYGDGCAAGRIITVLKEVPLDGRLLCKRGCPVERGMVQPIRCDIGEG
jgi:UDP-N-acetylglucosamine 2-epimerase (non-hydrolysing)/GDP/UDP-N,N'-diacetylbacillosamine 2-epimerase (hydrolysing)